MSTHPKTREAEIRQRLEEIGREQHRLSAGRSKTDGKEIARLERERHRLRRVLNKTRSLF